MNIGWWLESATWEHGNRIAMIDGDETKHTFLEINNLSNRMANILRDQFGVGEDDVVCTLLEDDHWHVALLYAVFKVGGVYCALNRTNTRDKFKYDLGIANPKLLVVNRQFLDTAKVLMKETKDIQNVAVCDNIEIESDYVNIRELVNNASDKFRVVGRSNDDLAVINFTAGSTGVSKGVTCTHGQYQASVLGTIHHYGLTSSDRNLMIGYLFHNSGIHSAVTCITSRTMNIWLGGWNAEKCLTFIDKYKVTYFHLIAPTMIRDMVRNQKFNEVDLSGIRMYLAGEPVPADIQDLLSKKGVRTLQGYGMTETMPLAVALPSMFYGDDKIVPFGSVGKPDCKDFGIGKIVDVVTKEEIKEPNIKGEVWFKGDVLTSGYYGDPERTKEAIDEEGWFHTSDLAYMDEDGWYYVGGRTDDIISSGAEKVSLSEIETALLRHPKVNDVACVGVRHDRFFEVAAAFVEPAEERFSEEALKDELDKFMSENIEKWKRPRLYIFMKEGIPRITAKRSKDLATLKKVVEGIELKEKDGVVTLSFLQGRK